MVYGTSNSAGVAVSSSDPLFLLGDDGDQHQKLVVRVKDGSSQSHSLTRSFSTSSRSSSSTTTRSNTPYNNTKASSTTCCSLPPSLNSSTSLNNSTTTAAAEYDNTMWKFVQDLFVQPSPPPSTTTVTTSGTSSASSAAATTVIRPSWRRQPLRHLRASWMLRFWCLTLPRLVLDLVRLFLAVVVLAPGFVRFAWYYWMVAHHETITYATESCRQRLDVYPSFSFGHNNKNNKQQKNVVQPQDTPARTPVVVFVAGGAWMIGYKLWGALLARSLLHAGNICVVMMDYRNYPWGCVPDQVQDLELVLNWTKQHIHNYGGDASQIVLVGESAGGHLATLFLLQKALFMTTTTTNSGNNNDKTSSSSSSSNSSTATNISNGYSIYNNQKQTTSAFELADCKGLVTIAAPLDLSLMMNSCAKHGLDREGLCRIFGVSGPAALENWDPLQLVAKCCGGSSHRHHRHHYPHGQALLQQLPPMLICQGTRDSTVPVESAKSFTTALQEQLQQEKKKMMMVMNDTTTTNQGAKSRRSPADVELRIYAGWTHTRANVEGPMEGDLTFHRDVWEAVQKWNKQDDVLKRNQDDPTVWKDLGRLCPTMLVKLGSFFMPV